jgi:hypothetical protein
MQSINQIISNADAEKVKNQTSNQASRREKHELKKGGEAIKYSNGLCGTRRTGMDIYRTMGDSLCGHARIEGIVGHFFGAEQVFRHILVEEF